MMKRVENTIIYEQPLNERMRTFLRLEHLFKQTAYALRGFSIWDSRACLNGLIDILDIVSRGDLKNEILKELERLLSSLSVLKEVQGVDHEQLSNILKQLEQAQRDILALNGQFGQNLREHELITSLRQRSTITGGDCNFDLPAYHFWLSRDPEIRIQELENWFDSLDQLQKPIRLILAIIRESVEPVELIAEAGFYQHSLNPGLPVQILRIMLPQDEMVFPEISAGKHRFSIRFLIPQGKTRPIQTEQTITFKFSSCAL
jgi:cell division protein ZapD